MYSNFGLDSNTANFRALSMCGTCNLPTALHTDTYQVTALEKSLGLTNELGVCDYDFMSNPLRPGFDYFLHDSAGNITVVEDYSGEPANIINLTDGVDYEFNEWQPVYGTEYLDGRPVTVNLNEDDYGIDTAHYRIEDDPTYYVNESKLEAEALDRWTDKDSTFCTITLEQHLAKPEASAATMTYNAESRSFSFTPATLDFNDQVRNVFVEGTAGFITENDPSGNPKTVKYHERLLNQFISKKTGKLHVGSIEFTFTESTVIATCINRECYKKNPTTGNYERASVKALRSTDNRDAMEDFIFQVIRHGNNHGPEWLRSRADFYKIHQHDCDLTCDPKSIFCNNNAPKVNDTDLTLVEFVFEHQRYCKDSRCSCIEWLAAQVPALTKVA